MYDELKKAAVSYFKLISQAEKNHEKHKIACVVVEIQFRQVFCLCNGFLRNVIG
jgi:hypothetical protein